MLFLLQAEFMGKVMFKDTVPSRYTAFRRWNKKIPNVAGTMLGI